MTLSTALKKINQALYWQILLSHKIATVWYQDQASLIVFDLLLLLLNKF